MWVETEGAEMIESGRGVAKLDSTNRALIGVIGAQADSVDVRPALRVAAIGVAHSGPPVLDWLDRQLLDAYQREFPICEMPFAKIARRFNCQASEVHQRLAALERRGMVSRIGPVFVPGCIDASTLVAMAVPPARLDSVVGWLNRYRGIRHVYEREHEFNLWFVLAAVNAGALYETLDDIRRRTGLDVLDLRPERDYGIEFGLPRWRQSPAGRCAAATEAHLPGRSPPLDASDRRLVRALRDGLPLSGRPYAEVADRAGLSEAQVMERLRRLLAEGVIKRIGVIVRHDALGYRANAMVAFDVPCARVDMVGERLARIAPVAQCYRRTRRAPLWPYNLHCTFHGRDRAEVTGWLDELLPETLRCLRRAVLFSRRRFRRRGTRCAAEPTYRLPIGTACTLAASAARTRVDGG